MPADRHPVRGSLRRTPVERARSDRRGAARRNWPPGSPTALRDADGAELSCGVRGIRAVWAISSPPSMRPLTPASRTAGNDLRGSALGCSTRAEALAEQCGGISTPALRQVSEPLPLTAREREIVRLLGSGLTTREVADRLCVSARTVEGHIYRAMNKTGSTTREELIRLLSPPHTA